MYRGTANVEHEVYVYTSNNWSHRNSNKRFEDKFGSHMRKPFYRMLTKRAIQETSHIIRKVLQSETLSLSGGDHRWFN